MTSILKQVGKVPLKYTDTLFKRAEDLAPTLEKVAQESKVDITGGAAGTGIFSRRNKIGTQLHDVAVGLKRRAESGIFEGIKKIDEYKKSLSGKDREDFDILYLDGDEKGVWKDVEDFDALGASEATRRAYEEFRNDSDDLYIIKNHHIRKDLESKGWKYDADEDIIMKPEQTQMLSSKEFNKMVIKDPKGNKLTFKNTSVEDIKRQYLDSGEYTMVRIHPNEVIDNLDYTHAIISNSKQLSDLPTFVLPYKAGGSRMYTKGTHYVKVGRTFYGEGGTKYLGYAKTLIAGTDIRRLSKYAEEVNKAVQIYNEYADDLAGMQRALDEANLTEFKVTTVQDLLGLIRTADNPGGILDADPTISKARVYRGDEKFVYDTPKIKQDYMIVDDLEGYDAELSALMEHSRQFYKKRGDEILENINKGSRDHVVDPFKIWQQNIMNAANEGQLGSLYKEWGEEFKQKFAPVIDKNININAMSGEEVIRTATIKAPNAYYNAMAREAARSQATYKAMKNTPTMLDMAINKYLSSLIESLPRDWWDNEYVDAIRNSKPVEWANAVIFRAYLGFFNIQQLFKNGILPIMNMVTLDPTLSIKAISAVPSVVLAHLNKGNKVLFEKAVKASGLSAEEMTKFLDYVEEYGSFKQMAQRPEIAAGGYIMSSRVFDKDLIFLKTANNSAQIVADLISFLKYGGSDLNKVAGYADDLMSNSSRINTSTFQRSYIGKLVGTFTSYPISVIEAVTGKHFTPEQKWRFALCQFAMWGFGGTLSRDASTNMYMWLEDNDIIENETIRSLLVDGVFTHIAALNGYDIREGVDITGVFNQMMATVPVLADMFGAVPDVPTGNVFSILADTYGVVKDIVAPDTDVRDYLAWARKTAARSHAPTSVRSLANFIIAKSTQEFWNKNGDILIKSVDDAKAIKILMGFKPIENRLAQMNYEYQKIVKEGITELFEDEVKSVLEELNTYRRTGLGKTEYSPEREQERQHLQKKYLTNVKHFMSVVKESYPEFRSFARTLINNETARGKDALAKTYVKDISEKNKQFIGVQ